MKFLFVLVRTTSWHKSDYFCLVPSNLNHYLSVRDVMFIRCANKIVFDSMCLHTPTLSMLFIFDSKFNGTQLYLYWYFVGYQIEKVITWYHFSCLDRKIVEFQKTIVHYHLTKIRFLFLLIQTEIGRSTCWPFECSSFSKIWTCHRKKNLHHVCSLSFLLDISMCSSFL